MSTKVTWLYGDPERDGEENDYHLYYDYKDFDVHLEINGREVPLPPKLRKELDRMYRVYSALRYAVEEVCDDVRRNDEVSRVEVADLDEQAERIERGEEYTFSLDEVMEFVDRGYHTRIELNDSGLKLFYFYDSRSGNIVVLVEDGDGVEAVVGLQEALDYISRRGASRSDLKKFLETAVEFLRTRGENR